MNEIDVYNLIKIFKIPKRRKGFSDAIKYLLNPKYELLTAVDNISLHIKQGELLGFIGPNGAGKSTTIKIMTGIMQPTSGEVFIEGKDVFKNRKQNAYKIGVVFGQRTQLWWDIPVIETFLLFKELYHINDITYKNNIDMFNDILNIGSFMYQPVRQLSLGQRMRADLCAALLHNPHILFLDEPTIGLDVAVKEKILDFISQINKVHKTTVILTTHDITDIEKLCKKLVIIDHGKLVYNGELQNFKKLYGNNDFEDLIKKLYNKELAVK